MVREGISRILLFLGCSTNSEFTKKVIRRRASAPLILLAKHNSVDNPRTANESARHQTRRPYPHAPVAVSLGDLFQSLVCLVVELRSVVCAASGEIKEKVTTLVASVLVRRVERASAAWPTLDRAENLQQRNKRQHSPSPGENS